MLKLDQHIYGITKEKGLSTLSVSIEMSEEDLKVLEKHSLYHLPNVLLYDNEAIKPKKYIYYKLNDESMVLGRGVDIGRDEFGRVGNFLFHNLILKLKEVEKVGVTPIGLIKYFEKKGTFQDIFCEGQNVDDDLKVLDNDTHKEVPAMSLFEGKSDLVSLLLYTCFNHEKISSPICICGNEDKIFDFLDILFSILPKKMWSNLSFNTFWYEDSKLPGLFFCCTNVRSNEIRLPNYSLKIDLEEGLYESKIDIQDKMKYEYAKCAAQKALSDKQGLSILYLLEELVIAHDWRKFIDLYKGSPQDIKWVIYSHNKENILTEILQGNIELLVVLREDLSTEERDRVFKSKILIERFIKQHDEIISKDFIEWFYNLTTQESKDFCRVILNNPTLLNFILKTIKNEKERLTFNITTVQGLIEEMYKNYLETENYDQTTEEKLLEVFCEFLEYNAITDIFKNVKRLPPSENPKILLLRALIMYRFGNSSKIISILKNKRSQQLTRNLLYEGMKTIDWKEHAKVLINDKNRSRVLFWRK